LIDAILDLSRIESGKLEISPAEIEPLALARVCLDLIRPQASKKAIQLSLNAKPDLPRLTADPRHLRQILLNLLSNAVKFTASGGRVELAIEIDPAGTSDAATSDEGQIVFRVKDNGIGIAPEDISRVQRPFGRISRSMGQAQDGTGLGLSISKSLAEANGASFHLSSVKGSGTTATIQFPLSPQATTTRSLDAVA
jgi:signal transduction histidine kinase